MQPNPKFRIDDCAALRAMELEIGVVHLFKLTSDGPVVAASAMDANAYVSPNWYAEPHNQVPTWNYVSVEIEGICAELDRAALRDQIDGLAALHEGRLLPKQPGTVAKVDAAPRDRMLSALDCFELRVTSIRGNHKLSQNRSVADREVFIAALDDSSLARAMAS